jgi:hypothetical protein
MKSMRRKAMNHCRNRFLRPLVAMILVGSAGFAGGLNAQEESPLVLELPSEWDTGDTFRIERIKDREGYADDELTFQGSTRSIIRVEILDKSDDHYVFKWVVEKSEMLKGASTGEALDQVMNLIKGVEFEFRTDAHGTPVRLENPDARSAFMKELFDKMLMAMREEGMSDRKIEKVREALEPLLQPESLEILLMKEPQLFYMPSGGSFAMGELQEYETLLPNPYGGRPFPAKGSFLLKDVNPAANFAILSWKQTLDKDAARKIMAGTLKGMLEKMAEPVPDDELLSQPIDIRDSAQFIYDLETGLPRSILHERTTSIRDNHRIDRLTFKMLPEAEDD